MSTAVVTGAGNGIGRAIAVKLATSGADVVVVDVDPDAAASTADEIGGRAITCDVSDEASVAELAARLDTVNVLVNNAGVWRSQTLHDSAIDDVRDVLAINVIGTWLVTRSLVPKFGPDGGSVVNITSVLGQLGGAGRGIYPASKAAVIAMTKQMASEYAVRRLRVNAVGPGLVLTEGTAGEFSDPGLQGAIADSLPLGRIGRPDDVAAVVAFLASEEASYITGQAVFVDGGWMANGSGFLVSAIGRYFESLASK